ncbi:hypothetical protein GQQ15_06250 [Pantoea agglomerans]|uniref:hypothetical protein n=1 Tax=Enterobacter agglomerans TaxID=549 RepID=UPI0013BB5285|nr:hypothetical protein [Pantoea agglomerans]NEG85062.1 hypothetical protein [Pantoea agglomerans]NEH07009.1 hypothetical protein [Pantoea agglomerans]
MDEWEISKREEMASDATIRDYFAAKAMHGYISTAAAPCIVGGLDGAEDELAKGAYKMADAMLRARGQ